MSDQAKSALQKPAAFPWLIIVSGCLIAMIGSGQPRRERLLLAFLGIRGVGSVYYIAYALNHGEFGDSERLWAVVGFIILVSILLHGVTATPLLARLARRREG